VSRYNIILFRWCNKEFIVPHGVQTSVEVHMGEDCHCFKPAHIDSVAEGGEFQEDVHDFLIPDLFRGEVCFFHVDDRNFLLAEDLGPALKTL